MRSDSLIADELGRKAFAGVRDKAGLPYWNHCLRVAERVRLGGASDAAIAAALLHDVVEDGLASMAELESAGLSARARALIDGMTRREGQSYDAYLARIAASGGRELLEIKLADNADNADPARIALLPPGMPHRTERYTAGRALLLPALERLKAGNPE